MFVRLPVAPLVISWANLPYPYTKEKTIALAAMVLRFDSGSREIPFRDDDCLPRIPGLLLPIHYAQYRGVFIFRQERAGDVAARINVSAMYRGACAGYSTRMRQLLPRIGKLRMVSG